jgi:hypothetical protein
MKRPTLAATAIAAGPDAMRFHAKPSEDQVEVMVVNAVGQALHAYAACKEACGCSGDNGRSAGNPVT